MSLLWVYSSQRFSSRFLQKVLCRTLFAVGKRKMHTCNNANQLFTYTKFVRKTALAIFSGSLECVRFCCGGGRIYSFRGRSVDCNLLSHVVPLVESPSYFYTYEQFSIETGLMQSRWVAKTTFLPPVYIGSSWFLIMEHILVIMSSCIHIDFVHPSAMLAGSAVMAIRLVRLLRVLKIVRALPQLR